MTGFFGLEPADLLDLALDLGVDRRRIGARRRRRRRRRRWAARSGLGRRGRRGGAAAGRADDRRRPRGRRARPYGARRGGGDPSPGLSHGSPVRPVGAMVRRPAPEGPASSDVPFLTLCPLAPESGSRYCHPRNPRRVPLPPSDRRRRLGRRLRSSFSGDRLRAPGGARPAAAGSAVSESTAMELSWYGRTCIRLKGGTPSSSPTPIRRSSGRPGAGSPARSSPSATPTTSRCRRRRAAARGTAAAWSRRASRTPSSSTARASTRSATSS